jgi:hypothetical protein
MAAAAGLECISPELALVCPEAREAAIAALPERDADCLLQPIRRSAPEYLLLRAVEASSAPPPRHVRLPVAVLAYSAQRAAFVVVEMAFLLALVAAAFALVATINS